MLFRLFAWLSEPMSSKNAHAESNGSAENKDEGDHAKVEEQKESEEEPLCMCGGKDKGCVCNADPSGLADLAGLDPVTCEPLRLPHPQHPFVLAHDGKTAAAPLPRPDGARPRGQVRGVGRPAGGV